MVAVFVIVTEIIGIIPIVATRSSVTTFAGERDVAFTVYT